MAGKEQSADEDLEVLRTQMTEKDKEIATEREARHKAEGERSVALAKASEEINNRVAADEVAIKSALGAAAAETKTLEVEYAAAAEKGDYAAMAAVNTRLVGITGRISGYQNQAAQIENWKKQQLADVEKRSQQTTQQTTAPTEEQQLAAYTPRTREWLSQHRDVMRDPRRMAKATAAHFDAIAENIPFESDAYFEFVGKRTGVAATTSALSAAAETEEAEPGVTEPTVVVETEPEERQPPPVKVIREKPRETQRTDSAAAPTRTTPSLSRNGQRPGEVRLSLAEQEAARISFPYLKTDEERYLEYAKNKVALQQEGRL